MKIKVEFDLTPEEFRESLGLPDISGLQDEALSMLTERVGKGMDNIDVGKIVESWFIQGIAASRKVQEVVAAAASGILDRDTSDEEDAGKE
ncbi:MAG: DUF6489 family protein [Woeseiaceae bacterium]|nr:DUF6489 family protein [Woeseiaceae bacterium]